MKVCAAIVTYGDRFQLLSQVLKFCLTAPIAEIALVDNGSSENSATAIDQFIAEENIPVYLKRFSTNKGSAKGFKTAIELAANSKSELILILDDDNLPRTNCIEILIEKWKTSTEKRDFSKTVILANRIDRSNFIEALQTKNGERILSRENNFLGFHIKDILQKFNERLFKKKAHYQSHDLEIEVAAAPYSGMLFHRSMVAMNGLPNEDYFLYQDDFEYTFKFVKKGGSIILIENAYIDDIEHSEYLEEQKGWLHHSVFIGKENTMYYVFRNMHYFNTKYRKSNNFIYLVNRICFWLLIGTIAILRNETQRLALLKTALTDAKNETLGFNPKYPLN